MQNGFKILIIDKSKEIETIKEKFGARYYFNREAHQAAADLWGVECNDHGVVLNRQEETLVEVGSCSGMIKLAETKKGYWLIGLSGQTAIGGFGYAPSVWDGQGFATYWDARAFGVERLITFFNAEVHSHNSCSGFKNKADARKAIELLQAERTPQLALF